MKTLLFGVILYGLILCFSLSSLIRFIYINDNILWFFITPFVFGATISISIIEIAKSIMLYRELKETERRIK